MSIGIFAQDDLYASRRKPGKSQKTMMVVAKNREVAELFHFVRPRNGIVRRKIQTDPKLYAQPQYYQSPLYNRTYLNNYNTLQQAYTFNLYGGYRFINNLWLYQNRYGINPYGFNNYLYNQFYNDGLTSRRILKKSTLPKKINTNTSQTQKYSDKNRYSTTNDNDRPSTTKGRNSGFNENYHQRTSKSSSSSSRPRMKKKF